MTTSKVDGNVFSPSIAQTCAFWFCACRALCRCFDEMMGGRGGERDQAGSDRMGLMAMGLVGLIFWVVLPPCFGDFASFAVQTGLGSLCKIAWILKYVELQMHTQKFSLIYSLYVCNSRTHARTHTRTHAHTHAHVHTCTRMHTHTYTCTHTHTCTHTCTHI